MNDLRCFIRRIGYWSASVLAIALVGSASAQTLLVDFGNNETQFRGIPVVGADSNGNYWTSLQPGLPALDMVDITNAPTIVDLYFDTPVGTDSYNGPAGPTDFPPLIDNLPFTEIDAAALGNLGGALEAAFDYAASPGSSTPVTGNKVRFQLQELDPTKTYTLTFFGSHKYSNDVTTVYSVYSDDTYANVVGTASLDVQDAVDASAHNQDMVATISNLSPQASNILFVEFEGATGGFGYLNAMQIEAMDAPGIVGDYNRNGTVDAADYTVWRDHLGQVFDLPNRDLANSGAINNDDYASWKSGFGGGGSIAATSVPEPGAIVFCLLASVGALSVRGRRR